MAADAARLSAPNAVVRQTRRLESVSLDCWRCGSSLELPRTVVVGERATCTVCWARLEVVLKPDAREIEVP